MSEPGILNKGVVAPTAAWPKLLQHTSLGKTTKVPAACEFHMRIHLHFQLQHISRQQQHLPEISSQLQESHPPYFPPTAPPSQPDKTPNNAPPNPPLPPPPHKRLPPLHRHLPSPLGHSKVRPLPPSPPSPPTPPTNPPPTDTTTNATPSSPSTPPPPAST